ncbi:GNAT family N-acetyltransferase [Candidatus Poribacteria bacterium]|nr:GNAT family N-acetyltransferase [Candidatus Poribacteria bacterium]
MLLYAENNLSGKDKDGRYFLRAYVNDFDTEFENFVSSRGYKKDSKSHRPMSKFVIPDPFPEIHVPDGFKIKNLADDNDLAKVHKVLWRGFNHPGEPPTDGIKDREKMQSGPNHCKEHKIVVEAPDGNFVSFAGLWFEPINNFGYIEPVATDPDYRRMELGTAVVMEGVRRCGEIGATVAYVGSIKPFYRSMGFKKLYTSNCWLKYF